jgi:hypothetical protein
MAITSATTCCACWPRRCPRPSQAIGKDALPARFGGEEFCVILRGAGLQEAARTAEAIRARVGGASLLIQPTGQRLGVTVSLGLAVAEAGEAAAHLIERADAALYEAKRGGRNRLCTDPPMPKAGAVWGDDDLEGRRRRFMMARTSRRHRPMLARRNLLRSGAAMAALPLAAQAQSFPDHAIRWVVGYPPGGASDTFARLIGAAMSARLGQNVVVENRPGGGAVLASERSRAPRPTATPGCMSTTAS